jgi:hypothetical protein
MNEADVCLRWEVIVCMRQDRDDERLRAQHVKIRRKSLSRLSAQLMAQQQGSTTAKIDLITSRRFRPNRNYIKSCLRESSVTEFCKLSVRRHSEYRLVAHTHFSTFLALMIAKRASSISIRNTMQASSSHHCTQSPSKREASGFRE